MKDEEDIKDDTDISIVIIDKKKCYCRGFECPKTGYLTQGSKALRIKIYSAGGWATAFYCKDCMKPLLKMCKKVTKDL